jgi:hypothetical protein
LFNHRQKITGARTPSRTPSNGLETANQKETFQSEVVEFVFTLFSQAFEDGHFTKREIFFGTLSAKLGESISIAASELEDSAKTPPSYDRITIFAQAAQATDIEQTKLRHLPLCLFRDEAPPAARDRGLRAC